MDNAQINQYFSMETENYQEICRLKDRSNCVHLCDIFPSVKSLMKHERFFFSFPPLTNTIFVTPIQLFCEESITKTTFPHNYINDFRIIWIDYILWWFLFVFHTFRTTNDNPLLNINYYFYCSSKIFLKQ